MSARQCTSASELRVRRQHCPLKVVMKSVGKRAKQTLVLAVLISFYFERSRWQRRLSSSMGQKYVKWGTLWPLALIVTPSENGIHNLFKIGVFGSQSIQSAPPMNRGKTSSTWYRSSKPNGGRPISPEAVLPYPV